MDRRRFIQLSTAAGLTLATPLHRHALASEELAPFEGPYWITINLAGAWDSTLFCDPKGDVTDGSGNGVVNQCYDRSQIGVHTVNGVDLPLAPGIRLNGSDDSYYHHVPMMGGAPVHVIDHLAQRGLTIINGIDAGLTNHRFGEQMAMAGSTKSDFPTLAALAAYDRLVDRPDRNGPMPLLSFGGYDGTGNLLPATRLNKLDVLRKITNPDSFGAGEVDTPIHKPATQALIDAALDDRRIRLERTVRLPKRFDAMSQLFVARSKEQHVGSLLNNFDFTEFESLGDMRKQAYVALRAFQAGLSVSANLILNGWDTHVRNDLYQTNKMWILFRALTYIKDAAEQLGIADQLNIVVGSDFGRTPHYSATGNPESGKDHHSVTSWMTMLWHQNRDAGLRVVGATNDGILPSALDGQLQTTDAPDGTILTPAILHKNLRTIAGIEGALVDTAFPLTGPNLNVWS